jgi:hypothetical protein
MASMVPVSFSESSLPLSHGRPAIFRDAARKEIVLLAEVNYVPSEIDSLYPTMLSLESI